MVIVRAAVVVIALICCAWFALGARQAIDLSRATEIASQQRPLAPKQVKRAQSLLDAAATLNPDQEVNVVRGELAIDQGQNRQAREILHAVIHREVNNLQAWIMYARGSKDNLVQAYAAQYVIRRLVRTFPARG
jgi:predicted Zn-dependent protease